jgi:hypothetical protein
MVDIVSKSSHEAREHRAFSFQIVSCNPHGTGKVIGRLSANDNLVVQKAHDMVGHARGRITCGPFGLLGRIARSIGCSRKGLTGSVSEFFVCGFVR